MALALNSLGYGGRSDWGMVRLAAWAFLPWAGGRYVHRSGAAWHLGPAALLLALVLALRFTLGGAPPR